MIYEYVGTDIRMYHLINLVPRKMHFSRKEEGRQQIHKQNNITVRHSMVFYDMVWCSMVYDRTV